MKKLWLLSILTALFLGKMAMAKEIEKNVLGGTLEQHSKELATGFYRDGYCRTGSGDHGVHVVAGIVTEDFLRYTKSMGNDLETPRQDYNFPGLKPGDHWCLCAGRWLEAERAGMAPPVDLNATNENALKFIPLKTLQKYQKK